MVHPIATLSNATAAISARTATTAVTSVGSTMTTSTTNTNTNNNADSTVCDQKQPPKEQQQQEQNNHGVDDNVDNVVDDDHNSSSYKRKRRRTSSSPSSSSLPGNTGSSAIAARVDVNNNTNRHINNEMDNEMDIDNKYNDDKDDEDDDDEEDDDDIDDNEQEQEQEQQSYHRPVIGVSLPWFEKGGPVYRRPKSLLYVPSENNDNENDGSNYQEKEEEEEQQQRRREQLLFSSTPPPPPPPPPTTTTTTTVPHPYSGCFSNNNNQQQHFAGLPIPMKCLGACAECGVISGGACNANAEHDVVGEVNTEEGVEVGELGTIPQQSSNGGDDVIVLCDGIGCDREFHLRCCRPPLQFIPQQEEYYCFDCHPNGGYSTVLLIDYLNEIEKEREVHADNNNNNNNGNDEQQQHKDDDESTPSRNRRQRRKPRNKEPNNATSSNNNKNNDSNNDEQQELTYVDELISIDMKENQPEWLFGPPRSELEVLHQQRRTSTNSRSSNRQHPQNHLKGEVGEGRKEERNNDGNNNSNSNNKNNNNSDSDNPSDALVGSAIRLYCPKTNQYHTGRILRVRRIEEVEGEEEENILSMNDNHHHQDVDPYYHDTECLVRFQAGRDYRKTSVTRWIRLEEHSLAVASSKLVITKFDNDVADIDIILGNGNSSSNSSPGRKKRGPKPKRSDYRWMPAKLWRRSSRELVMSMQLLEEEIGQIQYRNWRRYHHGRRPLLQHQHHQHHHQEQKQEEETIRNGGDVDMSAAAAAAAAGADASKPPLPPMEPPSLHQEWILAECIGRGIYKLVQVSTATKDRDVFDTTTTNTTFAVKTIKNIRNKRGRNSKSAAASNGISQREDHIMLALERAEREEQDRVRQWNNLPLENTWHGKALTCQDEVALGPLTSSNYDVGSNDRSDYDNGNEINKTFVIDPTPLVRTGLDRMYIMDDYVTQYNRDNVNEFCTYSSNSGNKANAFEISTGWSSTTGIRCTKDLAIGMSCDLVFNDSITACIQQHNVRERFHHQQQIKEHQQRKTEAKCRSKEDDDEEGEANINVEDEKMRIEDKINTKADEERIERERQVTARLEIERVERDRQQQQQNDRVENGRFERERAELERIGNERLDVERIERERQQQENERLENESIKRERSEVERIGNKRQEQQRLEKATLEREELERVEQSRIEKKKIEVIERERLEKARLEREELERAEQERIEKEKIELLERKRLEKARLERDELERELERVEQLRVEKDKRERLEKARLEREGFDRVEQLRNEIEENRIAKEMEERQRAEDGGRIREEAAVALANAQQEAEATTKEALPKSKAREEHHQILKSEDTESMMKTALSERVTSTILQNGGTNNSATGEVPEDREGVVTYESLPSQSLSLLSTRKDVTTTTTGTAPEERLASLLKKKVTEAIGTATDSESVWLAAPQR